MKNIHTSGLNKTLFSVLFMVFLPLLMKAQPKPPAIQMAKLWTVHIDNVSQSNSREFERLDSTQAYVHDSILRMYHMPVIPTYCIQTTEGKYFTFRARNSYGDLDQRPKYPDEVKKLFTENVNPYSDTIHTLLGDHHNEVWMWDSSSSYFPEIFLPNVVSIRYIHIHSEWVKPPMDALYDSVTTLFHAALLKEKFPLSCIVLYSVYGTGANHFVRHARTREELTHAQSSEQILIDAYGEQEGTALWKKWNECLYKTEDVDAVINTAITNLEPDMPWFGITVQ